MFFITNILHFFFFYITWLTRIQLKHFKRVICKKKPIQCRGTRNLNVIYLSNCFSNGFSTCVQYTYSNIFYGVSIHIFLLSFPRISTHITHRLSRGPCHIIYRYLAITPMAAVQVPARVRTGINFLQGTPSLSEYCRLRYYAQTYILSTYYTYLDAQ